MEFLHNENSRERYHAPISKFSFDALQQMASEHRGVQCVGYEAIAQGGYNTDGQELIARLSGSRSGQDDGVPEEILSYHMKSEVATMRYVETHTSIRIPRVHLAEFDSANAVGTRFMLMDRIVGSSLGKVWPTLQPEGHETVVRQLAGFQAELLKLEFPVLGSMSEDRKALTAEGVKGLQDDILDPPDNPYVLFHDDFKWANVLVSAEDPPQVVGLLDWEGSRICPVWNNRHLGGITIPDRVEDPDELAHYREIMWDSFRDAQPCTGFSPHLRNNFCRLRPFAILEARDTGNFVPGLV
ncbi:kinase-like domain-containing protein [Armillaria nabsnona]|nr:kinase-like domain-containing protein [Armillaria nabsnona]